MTKCLNKETQQELAEEWGVSQPKCSRWIANGAPFDEEKELAKWVSKNDKRKSRRTKEKLHELLSDKSGPPVDVKQMSLEQLRDFYAKKVSEATAAEFQDSEQIKLWNDLLLKTDESIRRSEAHAKKLGIDRGEMLSREEVERILRVVIYAGNACVKGAVHQIAERLAAMEEPAEIYMFLKPLILGGRIFEGFSKVSKAEGPTLIPDWVISAVQSEGENYLEINESG